MKYFLTYKVFLYVHLYQIINCCALEFMCIIIFICLFGFFFSFYFITTCSWYFSYNIVNKMFDFFSPPSNYWNDRKKVSGGTQKTGFKLHGVSPKLFGLTLPVLPPISFVSDIFYRLSKKYNPFTNAFAEKKKKFFFFIALLSTSDIKA